jgi:hypothetical protein
VLVVEVEQDKVVPLVLEVLVVAVQEEHQLEQAVQQILVAVAVVLGQAMLRVQAVVVLFM